MHDISSKHDTLAHCCFNDGPASQMVGQYCPIIVSIESNPGPADDNRHNTVFPVDIANYLFAGLICVHWPAMIAVYGTIALA